ncbi:MAG: hypothetical protein CR972_02475 [Candidatus Moraniibacteriota bacterium]|nr:MAG: hypothetical protein CR972_02475 [Candidatus Moranbacteria bacterium]
MDIKSSHLQKCVSGEYKKKQRINTDGISRKRPQKQKVSLDGFRNTSVKNAQNVKYAHTILLKDLNVCRRTAVDPERYIRTQRQRQHMYRAQYVAQTQGRRMDGVRVAKTKNTVVTATTEKKKKQISVQERFQNTYNAFVAYRRSIGVYFDIHFNFDLSPTRMWQASLAGAVIFGMVSMSFIYRNLGQSAFAKEKAERALAVAQEEKIERSIEDVESVEKGEQDEERDEKEDEEKGKNNVKEKDKKPEEEKIEESENVVTKSVDSVTKKENTDKSVKKKTQEKTEKKEVVKKSIDSVVQTKESTEDEVKEVKEKLKEKTLKEIAYETVEGYPIEKMLPYILEQDPEVAKYLIAIAKQESGWGKRVPVLNGQDCYNYWGYRGIRKLMGTGGHTCFNSRKDAVETVGKRLNDLIYEYDRTTAERLIVWKCGSSCAGHSQSGVDRWIGVVGAYYDKLSQKSRK